MRFPLSTLSLLAVAALAAGCAANANGAARADWRGEAAEKTYDRDLTIARLAGINNDDDYYQFVSGGRLYVLTSEADYTGFRTTGEVPYSAKSINGGPNGQTAIYGLIKNETKALELDPAYQGSAQRLYEGTRVGAAKDFYGQVQDGSTIYVFNNWADLAAFRQGRLVPTGYSVPRATPEGDTVVYVKQASLPAETAARFARLHAQPMKAAKAEVEVEEVDMSDFVLPPETPPAP